MPAWTSAYSFSRLLSLFFIRPISAPLRQDRQADRSAGLRLALPPREDRLGVFPELFGRFEQPLVQPFVVVFAIVRAVAPADLRTVVVLGAAMIALQVLAVCIDAEVPGAVVDIDADAPVHHEPPQVVEVFAGGGGVNGNREISAAEGRAVRAQHFSGWKLAALDGEFGHRPIVLAEGVLKSLSSAVYSD